MFKKLLLASLFALSTNAVSAFEIKGIALGQPLPEMSVGEFADVKCSTTILCMGFVTFAGYDNMYLTIGTEENGIVKRVSLLPYPEDFFELKDFLIKKYGNYSDLEHSIFTAIDGTQHEQEKITWRSNDGSVLEFLRFYGKNTSRLALRNHLSSEPSW